MPPFFYLITDGIRVTARPVYLQEQSEPSGQHFVFAYFIRIENVRPTQARLMSRRWMIHDEIGENTEVIGDGVVGEQPLIGPAQVHEYQSFCILKSGEGYMEGEYNFIDSEGKPFAVKIPRFVLSSTESPRLP